MDAHEIKKRTPPALARKTQNQDGFGKRAHRGDFMGVFFIPAFSDERRELSRRGNPTRQNIDVTIFSPFYLNRYVTLRVTICTNP